MSWNLEATFECFMDKMKFLDKCGQDNAADAFRVAMDLVNVFEMEMREAFDMQKQEVNP